MANNNTYKRPVLVWGNSFYINISLEKFNAGAYEDFDLTKATDLKVYLICATHNTEIPLPYEILQGFDNVLRCFVDYRLLHTTSYGVVVEGYDEQDMHFRFEMLPKEGFLVVNNTSGMSISDDVQVVDISARVGWGISYNGDLTNYYTKSEVDNLIAEIEIDLSDYYTKEEINQLVNQFPTKSEIDARFNDYYTKTQVNGLISDLENIVDDKQDTLVSGSNIKTINNESILGSGNIDIQGGGGSVEPIIVNYNETIPAETIAKILEQKTNVMMFNADTNNYYQLLRLTHRSNYVKLEFGVFYENPSDTRQITVMMYSYKKYDDSPYGTWEYHFNYLDDNYKIENLLSNKQDNLVSGSNIKTINNESILGEGNIDIQAGEDYSEQFKTTADALWDLDHRINKNEYITNKKLESIEDSTKETLDEFGDNINEQLSVAANTLIEHSERLAVQSDWNENDSSSLAYIQNKPTIQPQVQSDWNESDSSSLAYIQNKPTISTPVQSDWNETDTTSLAYIQNKPTIQPQVQSDWNETDTTSLAYIQNKPNISEPGFIKVTNGNKTGLVNYNSTGYNTNLGNRAMIQGEGTGVLYAIEASGYNSHAEGERTVAKGGNSHAEGYYTKATGTNSHAEGTNTTAGGNYSHAEGYYTVTHNYAEHAAGYFNISNNINYGAWTGSPDTLVSSIGNGSTNSQRHNALEVRQNGDIYYSDTEKIDGSTVHYYDAPMRKLQDVMVTSTTAGLKIEVVSALPASPDANTIYIVQ